MSGNNVRRNNLGDVRACARGCGNQIVVTAQMLKTRAYYCSACRSKASVESARSHREVKRRNNNAHHKRISGKRAAATAKWRANHPEKRAAHAAVQSAIRNGSLVAKPCEECGAKAHAHHDDYTKPLDVQWLCHAHHMERHAMLKAREAK